MKRTIVISAVNLRKGGTLTILRQCLSFLSSEANRQGWRIIALVHRRDLADYPHIEYIELPWAIDGWAKRLWCEYMTMHRISKELESIDLWLSLHDTTPRVRAARQAVYCQTSFPFLKWHWGDFRFDPKIPLFALFTRFAYQIGIRRNRYLIVQQEWLRRGFSKMFGIAAERFIVAPPPRNAQLPASLSSLSRGEEDVPYRFFFASTPDTHKGFETLAEATQLLERRVGCGAFETIMTIRGDENKYAQYLKARWGEVRSLHFAGLMDRDRLYAHYASTDCFVFPSRVETWGLPITEFLETCHTLGVSKPVLLADLPYAHETSAGGERVAFFPVEDAAKLADLMEQALCGKLATQSITREEVSAPYAQDWSALFEILLGEVNT